MAQEFAAELQRLEGKIQWTVLFIPAAIAAAFGTHGRVNVRVELDGHAFACTLLPSRNGHYLPFNQAMKAATKKKLGDTVQVAIARDDAPRVVEAPEWLQTALAAHETAQAVFTAMPDYLKREAILRITSAKTEPTRQKRLAELLASLAAKAE